MDNKKQKNAESGKKKIETKEILRGLKFALVSASAGIIEFGSKTLLAEVFHVNDTLSYVIALVLSVLWNFTFNRKFTFKLTNHPFSIAFSHILGKNSYNMNKVQSKKERLQYV